MQRSVRILGNCRKPPQRLILCDDCGLGELSLQAMPLRERRLRYRQTKRSTNANAATTATQIIGSSKSLVFPTDAPFSFVDQALHCVGIETAQAPSGPSVSRSTSNQAAPQDAVWLWSVELARSCRPQAGGAGSGLPSKDPALPLLAARTVLRRRESERSGELPAPAEALRLAHRGHQRGSRDLAWQTVRSRPWSRRSTSLPQEQHARYLIHVTACLLNIDSFEV